MKTLLIIAVLLIPQLAFGFTDQEAITTIVGEASNQGLQGMVLVGEVIRHRHSLKGCYGLHASHNAKEPSWVWHRAARAWQISAGTHFTRGATGFGSLSLDWSKSWWRRGKIITLIYKDQVFYKEAHGTQIPGL